MNDIKIEELIIDYLDGNIEPDLMPEVLKKFKQYGYNLNELEEIRNLRSRLGNIPIPEPGKNLDEKFYGLLKRAKTNISKPKSSKQFILAKLRNLISGNVFPKIAFNVLFLIIGLLIGRWVIPGANYEVRMTQMTSEMKEMKEVLMLSLLNQSSPTERIKAVNTLNTLSEVDTKVINALLETLDNDPNVNVRLVTVEALSRFAKVPEVRRGLIRSITNQESPLVQIALADLMVTLQEKNSVEQFKKLLAKKDLNYTVKIKIEEELATIMKVSETRLKTKWNADDADLADQRGLIIIIITITATKAQRHKKYA